MGGSVEQLQRQMAEMDKFLRESLSSGEFEEKSGDALEQKSGEDGSASLNFAAGLGVVNGDRAVYLHILKTFLEDHGGDLAEIEQSLENGDFQHIADLLHTLKGVTPVIGAQRLADITKRFNDLLASSDRENLPVLLAEMQIEFPLVLDAISSVLATESTRKTGDAAESADLPEMIEKGRELFLLIKNMDMSAGEYAVSLMAQLEAQGYLESGEGDELLAALHDFDFERALEKLTLLRQRIEDGAVGAAH